MRARRLLLRLQDLRDRALLQLVDALVQVVRRYDRLEALAAPRPRPTNPVPLRARPTDE